MRYALVLLAACRANFDDQAKFDAPNVAIDSVQHTAYWNAVMTDHPVAFWRLGDAPGGTAKDELGTYDGVYSGTAIEGQAGALSNDPDTAVAFDGASGKVVGPDALAFSGNAPFTIEIWVKPDIIRYQHFLTKESRIANKPQAGWALLGTPGVIFERFAGPMVMGQTSQHTIPAMTWSHVVGTYDGATCLLYIDGALVDTAAAPDAMAAYTSPVLIGANENGAYLQGAVDEAAVYDFALSGARVLAHFTIARGL